MKANLIEFHINERMDDLMKRYYSLLTVGILTLASGALASVALFLASVAGIFEDGALVAIQLVFCAMTFLYLLFSLLADNMLENKKRALASWGLTLFTALAGSVLMSGQIAFYKIKIAPLFLLGDILLVIACIIFTVRGIRGKGNGMPYLLASILALFYTPLCSWAVFAWDSPLSMTPFALPAALLFGIYIVSDLIYYHARLKRTRKD